jgi:hypothetical protein
VSFFEQCGDSRLYTAGAGPDDRGWVGFLLPPWVTPPGPGIELGSALTDAGLGGSFLLSALGPDLVPSDTLDAFIDAMDGVIGRSPAPRAFAWLTDPARPAPANVLLMGIDGPGQQVVTTLVAPLAGPLQLQVASGVRLSLVGTTTLSLDSGSIRFTGVPLTATQITAAALPFAGGRRGCLGFPISIQRPSLANDLSWGFQYVIPRSDVVRPDVAEWLPLADGQRPSGSDWLGFDATIDPSDPRNRSLPDRTALAFTGQNLDGAETVLVSEFRTTAGEPVVLVPVPAPLTAPAAAARLVFNQGIAPAQGAQRFQAAPAGDFTLALADGTSGQVDALLCGLQGTEYVSFQARAADGDGGYPGDRLRFQPGRPAYAPRYPFPPTSPVGPPYDTSVPLLDPTYTTAWATVVHADGTGGLPYVAQPRRAPLYGRDALIHGAHTALFGSVAPSVALPDGAPFPLAPYAAVQAGDGQVGFTAEQIERFEREVIGPTRRAAIGQAAPPPHAAGDGTAWNATTPTGLLTTIGPGGAWTRVLLAQNLADPVRRLCLCQPDGALRQALGTSQLFLVVTDPKHLGAPAGGDGECGAAAAFCNEMDIAGWALRADVGANQYADYTNVLIVKGRQGPLYDGSPGSLVANPDQWTQPGDFAAASGPAELVVLSAWLQQYFQDAAGNPDTACFARFNAIARNPAWTGILVLRVTIASLPPELAPIVAGVTAPERFAAHHLGIEISQVANDPSAAVIEVRDTTSMFGLIDYADPAVDPADPSKPVPPAPGADYDFRLLSLKVLFENTAVRMFQSAAQITLNRLFGTPVTGMGTDGNPFNTIVLSGSYQGGGGEPRYTLASSADTVFTLGGGVLSRVEVTGATMSPRRTEPIADTWFALSGFLDFALIQTADGGPFDVFSFGNDAGTSLPRRGLSFSNLGLEMTYPASDPTERTFSFVPGEIRFDIATSTPRQGSLFTEFALQLAGLITGDAGTPPNRLGYSDVVTDARLAGVAGDAGWYGLRYQLDMGTPGALAADVGLTSSLLTAWAAAGAAGGDLRALVGLQLPGTGGGADLISLQNVLRLSVGPLRLTRGAKQDAFLLMLTDFALKFLGLLKIPPAGSALLYLFGNPRAGGKPSGLGWYALYLRAPQG